MMLPRGVWGAYLILHFSFESLCQESSIQDQDGPKIGKKALQEALRELLQPYDPFRMPFIPTLAFNPQENMDIALSFTNVSFEGISTELFVDKLDIPLIGKHMEVSIRFGKLSMRANQYVAGGRINNLPFTGKSCARAQLEDFIISLEMNADIGLMGSVCIEQKSTYLELGIRKPVVYFDDLNPGTDLGELVNTVLSGSIPDITDFVQQKFNGDWHDDVDAIIVATLNSILCKEDSLGNQ